MSYWIAYHAKSEQLAGQADTSKLLGHDARSRWLYNEAAFWEEKALDALPEGEKARTMSITVTSAAYLYIKGQNIEAAKAIVEKWINSPNLQSWARDEMNDILKTIELPIKENV